MVGASSHTPKGCRFDPKSGHIPYFALYNVHFFAQIFEGKNKDAHHTWVVLIPYLYVFNSFIYVYVLKVLTLESSNDLYAK